MLKVGIFERKQTNILSLTLEAALITSICICFSLNQLRVPFMQPDIFSVFLSSMMDLFVELIIKGEIPLTIFVQKSHHKHLAGS